MDGVEATVVGDEFVGGTAMIFLETATGHEIKVQKSHDELSTLNRKPGANLIVSWTPENCHVLPGE
nr:TOBE domain-containing protein [Roseovarius dicentrarchi]